MPLDLETPFLELRDWTKVLWGGSWKKPPSAPVSLRLPYWGLLWYVPADRGFEFLGGTSVMASV